jgi:hypothetical protein
VLKQTPVFWIWDKVEPITGFPAGTASDWSAAEQKELRDFLSDALDTKAKFLLTSRRDEQAWLGEMPRRVEAPPMPMQERLQRKRGLDHALLATLREGYVEPGGEAPTYVDYGPQAYARVRVRQSAAG